MSTVVIAQVMAIKKILIKGKSLSALLLGVETAYSPEIKVNGSRYRKSLKEKIEKNKRKLPVEDKTTKRASVLTLL